jgi:Mor family transcriptional regulator
MKDILLLKPLKENEEEFIKILSKQWNMEIKLLQEMKNYFKEDFYLILSLFAGQQIKFPMIKEMSTLSTKIDIYKDFEVGIKKLQLNELLEEISEKHKCSSNQAYTVYKEVKEWLS